ncbi:E3 ubiquitin protein ligase DRIP1-like [Solanum lycopersicum]|uniref:Ubiquitin-like domain-containing protein n=1 Tax=Solanum lycopersicum TaxID=4081 RepID=K4DDP0_SOLLC|nr:polycomb group RING finger protein 3-like [Solanum lycopersicum]
MEFGNNPKSACRQHGGHKISLLLHHMSSEENSACASTMSAAKMPQLATSVSTTNAEIGKSIIVENIKEYKKKKRSKNRKACEKRQDTGPEERESSTQENHAFYEKQKELSSFWFKLIPQGGKKGLRLSPLDRPNIHLKDNSATVTLIQKFIAQKLNFNDHTEVDVLCYGEKLNGDMTLKNIQLRWKSHLPNSGEGKVKWELEQAMTQLGHIRSKKLQTPPKK